MEVTEAQLAAFVKLCEEVNHTYMREHFPTLPLPIFSVTLGSRYAKIVRKDYPDAQGGSVHLFVDLTNGDVLKAASWKAPAKHARGNLHNPDCGREALTQYGAKYLK